MQGIREGSSTARCGQVMGEGRCEWSGRAWRRREEGAREAGAIG